ARRIGAREPPSLVAATRNRGRLLPSAELFAARLRLVVGVLLVRDTAPLVTRLLPEAPAFIAARRVGAGSAACCAGPVTWAFLAIFVGFGVLWNYYRIRLRA